MAELILRKARENELDEVMSIIDMAKAHLKAQGIDQWQRGYPDRECLAADLKEGTGLFILLDDKILGYVCIDFSGERAYENLAGTWHTAEPYAVIHRLAFKDKARGLGLGSSFFTAAEKFILEKGIMNIRADTDEDNQKMQHLLLKQGFKRCGTVIFDNSPKAAFDKILG